MGLGPGSGPGGARPGAGRPKGAKNKLDLALRERLQEKGADPVDVLIGFMEEGKDDAMRMEAAKALIPYAYPRLASQDISLSSDNWPDVLIELRMPDGKPAPSD